ncbi:MAG: HlyD family efflux transporter periplasmic adaptor subunit [Acidobacteria bacterium]|nr:HlyD family efflux transporter periplasmic adaptor subunit [Acidobacteriota bacterium]
MARKYGFLIALFVLILLAAYLVYSGLSNRSDSPPFNTAKAVRRDIKVAISTNGIIEPISPSEIYAPIDAFVAGVQKQEGSEIAEGQLLIRLESRELRTSLAEAKAALLQARRQAQAILGGPLKEEVAALDASIAERELQLEQQEKDLQLEESLLAKQATPRATVEAMRKQRDILQLQLNALRQKKQDLQMRYSTEEKQWEQDKVSELAKQVSLLERQLQLESIVAPENGLIYSLSVKPGSYVTRGQTLAQIYEPGKIRLRAYVDEPDLGRIRKGQSVLIEWDGMPDQQWSGAVQTPAEQVVAMNNRSIGYVLCSIDKGPNGLIPNLNVKVEIATDFKANVLIVPRSAVFNDEGKPAVLLLEGTGTKAKPVNLGLFTSEEIEILQGIDEGDSIVLNPGEADTGS